MERQEAAGETRQAGWLVGLVVEDSRLVVVGGGVIIVVGYVGLPVLLLNLRTRGRRWRSRHHRCRNSI